MKDFRIFYDEGPASLRKTNKPTNKIQRFCLTNVSWRFSTHEESLFLTNVFLRIFFRHVLVLPRTVIEC